MLTNPRNAFGGQSRSPNVVPFHMLGTFPLVNSNFVSKTKRKRFSDIRLQKCCDLEIRVRGHSRSLEVPPFCRLLVFYRNSVRKTHGIWDIRLQKCRDLENRIRVRQGHWKCHHARAHMISYWRPIVSLTMALSRVVSEIFNVEKCCDLEIGVKGHSNSLRLVSFDRLCMVYC